MTTSTWIRTLLLGLISASFIGCAAPTRELDSYLRAFEPLKQSTEEMLLRGKVIAEKHEEKALDDSERSRRERLADGWKKDLNVRLDALDVVVAFNEALASLAQGDDPQVTADAFDGLSSSLTKLSGSLPNIASFAGPYGQFITQALGSIEQAARTKQFREGVIAAEPVVPAIFDILEKDSDSIIAASEAGNLAEHADGLRPFSKNRAAFARLAVQYTFDRDLDELYEGANEIVGQLRIPNLDRKLPELEPGNPPTPKAIAANSADRAELKRLVGEMTKQVGDLNEIEARIRAEQDLLAAYRSMVKKAQAAFTALIEAAKREDFDITGSVVIMKSAIREFKLAKIKYQESN